MALHSEGERRKKEQEENPLNSLEAEKEDEENVEQDELPDAPNAPIHPSLFTATNSTLAEIAEIPKDSKSSSQIATAINMTMEKIKVQATPEETRLEPETDAEIEGFRATEFIVPCSPTFSSRETRSYFGCSLLNNYNVQKKIGSGTFGEVTLGVDRRTGRRVALKRILIHNEKEGMPMTALREIRILKRLAHPNIIQLKEMAVKHGKRGKERAASFMIFPYMEHDLDGLLQNNQVRFTIPQVKSYTKQLLEGVNYLHKSLILHRDIKSANILVNNKGYLKIADFGLARPFNANGNGKYTNMVVTRWFRPPELLMGATIYNGAVDMWGVGCVFGEILKRRAILPGSSDIDQLNLIWTLCGTPDELSWPGKSYLQLPMFKDGLVADFDASTRKEKTLGEKFPAHQFKQETYNLLDDLLQICPEERLTAEAALKSKYFYIAPLPAVPGTSDFNVFADSHELDSRNAKMSRLQKGTKIVLGNHFDSGRKHARESVGADVAFAGRITSPPRKKINLCDGGL